MTTLVQLVLLQDLQETTTSQSKDDHNNKHKIIQMIHLPALSKWQQGTGARMVKGLTTQWQALRLSGRSSGDYSQINKLVAQGSNQGLPLLTTKVRVSQHLRHTRSPLRQQRGSMKNQNSWRDLLHVR